MADLQLSDLTVNVNVVDRGDYLRACLTSLSDTTPEGPRLHVLFNGSPKHLVEDALTQIDRWSGPHATTVLETTEPLWKSHQIALDTVETPLVNFMGDDDIVLEPRLAELVDMFNDIDPTPGAVTTFAMRIGPSIAPIRMGSSKNLGPTSVDEWRRLSREGAMFEMNFPGAVFRTDAIRSAGGFEEEFTETADNRLFTVIGATEPVLALPNHSFGYRVHPNSVSSSRFLSQAQAVRHVAACAIAAKNGKAEPSRAEFIATESADPMHVRLARDMSARSQMYFRRGAAELLTPQKFRGVARIALSAAFSPLQFGRSLMNQASRRGPTESAVTP